mmetsp:Transcript_63941/g.151244  ORF Transcript_63941/g.151244 Transcript_63941/m.151244 type:complete len:85 (+) Transcript_63941:579-833(+)
MVKWHAETEETKADDTRMSTQRRPGRMSTNIRSNGGNKATSTTGHSTQSEASTPRLPQHPVRDHAELSPPTLLTLLFSTSFFSG